MNGLKGFPLPPLPLGQSLLTGGDFSAVLCHGTSNPYSSGEMAVCSDEERSGTLSVFGSSFWPVPRGMAQTGAATDLFERGWLGPSFCAVSSFFGSPASYRPDSS